LTGNFNKEQNRSDFADAYNGLVQSLEAVMTLEKRFAETGDIGLAISEVEKEPLPSPLRRKRSAISMPGGFCGREIVINARKTSRC
jgi:hypothetical protein